MKSTSSAEHQIGKDDKLQDILVRLLEKNEYKILPPDFSERLLALGDNNESNLGSTFILNNAAGDPVVAAWTGQSKSTYNRPAAFNIKSELFDANHPVRIWGNQRQTNESGSKLYKKWNTRLGDTEKIGLYNTLFQLQGDNKTLAHEGGIRPLSNLSSDQIVDSQKLQALYDFARNPQPYRNYLERTGHTVNSYSILPPCKPNDDGIGLDCDQFVRNAYPRGSVAYYRPISSFFL